MIIFDKFDWQRMVMAAAGALVLSTTTIAMTAAPVQAAEPCMLVAGHADAQQLACSLA